MAANGHSKGNARLECIQELETLLEDATKKLQNLSIMMERDNMLDACQFLTQRAAPLVHQATTSALYDFIKARNVTGLAETLTDDQVESVWLMPNVSAGELYGVPDSMIDHGKKVTIALVLILLHHMTSEHNEVLADTIKRCPELKSTKWQAQKVSEEYNELSVDVQVYEDVLHGDAKCVTKYAKVAALMILARLQA